jgi:peptidoglycan/xylan/chitin deacetylase (PgdA/CDA1 family)
VAGHNATALRPLVDSGQVALGNHTWSHLALMTLGDREVAEEIRRDRDFLRSDLGVRDDPFFRPPFGARTPRVLAAAELMAAAGSGSRRSASSSGT